MNIFLEYVALNRQFDEVCNALLSVLAQDKSQLTPAIILEVFQAISSKAHTPTYKEYLITDHFMKAIPLEEFDINQKCEIFKCIAFVEVCFHLPRYKIPALLISLRKQIKDKLQNMNENGVLSIIQAY